MQYVLRNMRTKQVGPALVWAAVLAGLSWLVNAVWRGSGLDGPPPSRYPVRYSRRNRYLSFGASQSVSLCRFSSMYNRTAKSPRVMER